MIENYTKTLVFTTLDISQLKELMLMKLFRAEILCICGLMMQADISKKKMKMNI